MQLTSVSQIHFNLSFQNNLNYLRPRKKPHRRAPNPRSARGVRVRSPVLVKPPRVFIGEHNYQVHGRDLSGVNVARKLKVNAEFCRGVKGIGPVR